MRCVACRYGVEWKSGVSKGWRSKEPPVSRAMCCEKEKGTAFASRPPFRASRHSSAVQISPHHVPCRTQQCTAELCWQCPSSTNLPTVLLGVVGLLLWQADDVVC